MKNRELRLLTDEMLVNNQFSLFSVIYPAMPSDGYPIVFNFNGQIGPGQLQGSEWKVQNKSLIINEKNTNESIYTYNKKCNSLTNRIETDYAVINFEIAIIKSEK
ncbi:hypothetical protein [Marinicella sp. W31]|uniref:hypothetical protein n=1 Tax=Marinicella sp. W31 TaxID=3023713 RepID=UPI003757B9B1